MVPKIKSASAPFAFTLPVNIRVRGCPGRQSETGKGDIKKKGLPFRQPLYPVQTSDAAGVFTAHP